jgi:hypothetical protein
MVPVTSSTTMGAGPAGCCARAGSEPVTEQMTARESSLTSKIHDNRLLRKTFEIKKIGHWLPQRLTQNESRNIGRLFVIPAKAAVIKLRAHTGMAFPLSGKPRPHRLI